MKNSKAQVPKIIHAGKWKCENGNRVNVAVISKLGPDLEARLNKCERKFDLGTVLHIGV